MFQNYDYISIFVPLIDIPVSLDNLFQRIAAIYGVTSTLSCLGHFHAYQTISNKSTSSTLEPNR